MLSDDKCHSLRELYLQAMRLECAAERESFLDKACENQPDLRSRLEELLAARHNEQSKGLLERAAANIEIDKDFLGGDGFSGSGNLSPQETRDLEGRLESSPTLRNASRVSSIDVAGQPMIGHFKLLEEIGHGGMGTVYMAKQTEPVKRDVALKIIKPGMDTREVIARFEAERQALAMMDHPHIAKVFDGGTTDQGRPYFVMELVRGVTITEFCKQKRLLLRERLQLFIDVCKAVQHAHQKGIIHRDLKPSNVLVTMHDHMPVVKVIDFGVAKALNQELTDKTLFTQFSQMIGTPLYMAPEQAQMSGMDIDTRSDIYSLGVVLYELLTGTTPFDRDTMSKLGADGFRKLLCEQDPERPSVRVSTLKAANRSTIEDQRQLDTADIVKQLNGEVDWIIMKALEKDRERRYETANAFAADVQRYLNDEPVEACPPSIPYQLRKLARRHRSLVSAAAVVALAMLLATGLLLNERSQTLAALAGEHEQRLDAQKQRKVAEAQRKAARLSELESLRQRDAALRNQYIAEIVSGHSDLEQGNLQRLNRKLMSHLPLDGQPDRRGWEWKYLWSQCHPEVRTLAASSAQTFATWSPDGEYIGSSGDVWRAATGEAVRRINPSSILNYRSDWSPDGGLFAWGKAGDDNGIYLWNAQTNELRELRGHAASVWTIAFSPDGSHLASGGIDKTTRIWNIASGETIRILSTPQFVNDLAWSPDGRLLVAGLRNQQIKVWKSATWDMVAEPKLPMTNQFDSTKISWHPSGESLAILASDAWCLLRRRDWSVTKRQDHKFKRGRDLAWSPDGETLAVADGEAIVLWDPSTVEVLRTLNGHSDLTLTVSWSPDGLGLVSSDNRGGVKIWNLKSTPRPPGFALESPVRSLSFLTDNQTLAVEQAGGDISYWNSLDGNLLHRDSISLIGKHAWSPDQQLVACYSPGTDVDSKVRVIEPSSGKVHAVRPGSKETEVLKIAWSTDSSLLAIAEKLPNQDTVEDIARAPGAITMHRLRVVVWDVRHEQVISEWLYVGPGTNIAQMAWAARGTHLAVTTLGTLGDDGSAIWQGHLYVVESASGETVLKHNVGGGRHRANVKALAWRPDGRAVVTGTTDGVIEAVTIESGRVVFSNRLRSTSIQSLSWNPNGGRIVSASDDGLIRLLIDDSGEDLLTFTLDDAAKHAAWNPAGNRLAAATSKGTVHVWDASRADELSQHGIRRGELALGYLQTRSKESPAEKHQRLREFLRLAPDTFDFWPRRGDVRAQLGEFERAEEEYAKAIAPGLERSFGSARRYGLALLGANKVEAYKRHCTALLGSFSETSVLSNGGIIARLCALTDTDSIDMKVVRRLARTDFEKNVHDGGDRTTVTLGAVQYRSGRYEDATATLTKIKVKFEQSGNVGERGELATVLYFLSMSRHRQGHANQAQRYLDEAAAITAVESDTLHWTERVQLQILGREAAALIRDDRK